MKAQRDLVKFLLKNPIGWHSFGKDKATMGLVSATSNLGILEISSVTGDQMRLRSTSLAEQFINNYGD